MKRDARSRVPFEFLLLLALVGMYWMGKVGVWLFNGLNSWLR